MPNRMARRISLHHYSEFSETNHFPPSPSHARENFTLNVRNKIIPRSVVNSMAFNRWTIQRRIFDTYCFSLDFNTMTTRRSNAKRIYSLNCVSRLMKNSINRSKIYPLEGVISFSRRWSWHNWRRLRTKIGSWSGDDCKSIVKIKSMNVRFSWSANGSVLYWERLAHDSNQIIFFFTLKSQWDLNNSLLSI